MNDIEFYKWWSEWIPEIRSVELTPKMAAKAAWFAAMKKADKISEDVGLKSYQNGDLAGWAACDDVGHKIRGDESPENGQELK